MKKSTENTVTVTWGQIFIALGAIFSVLLGLANWVNSEIKTNVAHLREDIIEGREVARELSSDVQKLEAALREDFQALRVIASDMSGEIRTLVKTGSATENKLSRLENRVMVSVDRQQSFERYIITRVAELGIPEEKRISELKEPSIFSPSVSQEAILKALGRGAVDPLENWYSLLGDAEKTAPPELPPE